MKENMKSLLTVKTDFTLTPEIKDAFEYLHNDAKTVRKLDDHAVWWPPKDEILAYSVTTEPDGTPATMSIVQARPFYNGMVRLLSRYYASGGTGPGLKPKWIEDIKNGVRLSTIEMIHQQVAAAGELGYTNMFISRARAASVMDSLLDLLGDGWHGDEKYYQLCNGPTDCQQRIIWTGVNTLAEVER